MRLLAMPRRTPFFGSLFLAKNSFSVSRERGGVAQLAADDDARLERLRARPAAARRRRCSRRARPRPATRRSSGRRGASSSCRRTSPPGQAEAARLLRRLLLLRLRLLRLLRLLRRLLGLRLLLLGAFALPPPRRSPSSRTAPWPVSAGLLDRQLGRGHGRMDDDRLGAAPRPRRARAPGAHRLGGRRPARRGRRLGLGAGTARASRRATTATLRTGATGAGAGSASARPPPARGSRSRAPRRSLARRLGLRHGRRREHVRDRVRQLSARAPDRLRDRLRDGRRGGLGDGDGLDRDGRLLPAEGDLLLPDRGRLLGRRPRRLGSSAGFGACSAFFGRSRSPSSRSTSAARAPRSAASGCCVCSAGAEPAFLRPNVISFFQIESLTASSRPPEGRPRAAARLLAGHGSTETPARSSRPISCAGRLERESASSSLTMLRWTRSASDCSIVCMPRGVSVCMTE